MKNKTAHRVYNNLMKLPFWVLKPACISFMDCPVDIPSPAVYEQAWLLQTGLQRYTLNVLRSLVSVKALLLFLTKWCAGEGGHFTESHVHQFINAVASGIAKHDVQRFSVILQFAVTSSSHDLNWRNLQDVLMILNAVVLLADICSATMCNHGSVACFNAELSSSSMGEYILGTSTRVDLLQNKNQTRKQKSQATTNITQREHCPQHQKANHDGLQAYQCTFIAQFVQHMQKGLRSQSPRAASKGLMSCHHHWIAFHDLTTCGGNMLYSTTMQMILKVRNIQKHAETHSCATKADHTWTNKKGILVVMKCAHSPKWFIGGSK